MILLPLGVPLALFGSTVTVFDIEHTRDVRGEGSQVRDPDRTLSGVVQPAGDKLTQLVPEGARSDGAMVLHSADPTIVAADLSAQGSTGRQTYMKHADEVWKVWALQDWRPHTAIRRFLLTKYVGVPYAVGPDA